MDAVVCRWIVEFLLPKNIEDETLKKLLLALPVLDPSLKKAMLVRCIVSEMSKSGVASQKMLELMERLEELDYQSGLAPSRALQAAYCDVAVDVTLRTLEESEEKYAEAVNKFWETRIGLMIRRSNNNNGLVCEDLREWKDNMEASVLDGTILLCRDDPLKNLRGSNYESLKSLRVYVNEAWTNMSPSFLQRAAQVEGVEQLLQVMRKPVDADKKKAVVEESHVVEVINLEEDEGCGVFLVPRPPFTAKNVQSSPLKKKRAGVSIEDRTTRRRMKFWSNLEEDTLRDAVKILGAGNWKSILKQYKHIFEERTEVDLKDKWRNMMR